VRELGECGADATWGGGILAKGIVGLKAEGGGRAVGANVAAAGELVVTADAAEEKGNAGVVGVVEAEECPRAEEEAAAETG
jgi:hypothetical protein